jgi:NTE family protein
MPWSRAVLHQADHAIFVAQAHRPAPPSELETLALDLIPQTQRRLVLIHPHRMQRATGTAHWLTSRPVFLHHHVALTEDGEDIARLARFLTGRAIGMVLSGGGAFGVAHVGVWRAIRDLGIPVDIVGGTSVGSAMAGAIALGRPGGRHRAPGGGYLRPLRCNAARDRAEIRLSRSQGAGCALQQHYGDGPIEDLWLPFYAVAADLSSMA